MNKHLIDVPANLVGEFQNELFDYLDANHPNIADTIRDTKVIDAVKDELTGAIVDFKVKFLSER